MKYGLVDPSGNSAIIFAFHPHNDEAQWYSACSLVPGIGSANADVRYGISFALTVEPTLKNGLVDGKLSTDFRGQYFLSGNTIVERMRVNVIGDDGLVLGILLPQGVHDLRHNDHESALNLNYVESLLESTGEWGFPEDIM